MSILWVLFVVSHAEPLSIQSFQHKLLELSDQLPRRMQSATMAPLSSSCSAACPSMQKAYGDMEAATSRAETEQLHAFTELFAAYCANRGAIACGVQNQDCIAVLGGEDDLVTTLNCVVCDACPSYPRIYSGLADVLQGQTMEAVCPMMQSLKCVTSSSACAALTNGTLGTSFEEFLKRESDCVQGGYATDFPAASKISTGCATACPALADAFEYTENVSSSTAGLNSNLIAAMSIDAFCMHKASFDCAFSAGPLCSLLALPSGERPTLAVAVPALDCACLACPHLPRVYEAFATEGFASPEPEKYMPVLCPMTGTLKCFEASKDCSEESFQGFTSAYIAQLLQYESNCSRGGFPTDYRATVASCAAWGGSWLMQMMLLAAHWLS